MTKPKKVQPVMLVARDYIVLEDGTRYEKGEELPADVAALAGKSHINPKPKSKESD